ncbi:Nucleoid-associated protein YejK [compost metagenome]
MNIQESIIHGLLKERETSGPGSVLVRNREAVLPIDERLETLGDEVLKLYARLANGYGTFGDQELIHKFPPLLGSYVDSDIDLLEFSKSVCLLISEPMSSHNMATTSWPIFIKYSNQGREWILVAVLKLKEGVGINQDTLELNDSLFFDIGNLYEAARIDIEKWKNNEQPYLSFIKRRGGEGEASVYFRNALSCTEYTDAKHNTVLTLKAVDDFCAAQGWESERVQSVHDALYGYCAQKKSDEEPVNLVSLSAIIHDQDPEAFIEFVRENEYAISEVFSP